MGLMTEQDRRPRDWTYLARFDKKDLPSLEEMARHIRETHDTTMIEDFNRKCEQKLKDESATLDNGLEIKTVTKTGDLVLNPGLDHCIKIILGQVSTRWTHFGFGATSGVGTVTDTALYSETIATRVALAWAEPVGMRLLFGGISSQTSGLRPTVAAEIGVYNGSAAGAVLLNRSGFATAPQQQSALLALPSISTAPIVVSAVIEFCPVA
jgi:hypothetical protein